MIQRLSVINEQNVSLTQEMHNLGSVIEVINLMGRLVYFSPNETLFHLDMSRVQDS